MRLIFLASMIAWQPVAMCLGQGSDQSSQESSVSDVFFIAAPGAPDAWGVLRAERRTGEIRQFDAVQLIYMDADQQLQKLPGNSIERLEVAWDDEATRNAVSLLEQRQYRQAITEIQAALRSGIPQWQQRVLIAGLVQAAEAMGNPRTAGILFLNLSPHKPPAMLYGDMPLCWTSKEPDRNLLAIAKEWIADDDPHAQLLGASWLLLGEQSDQAANVLTRLQSSENKPLAQLAACQSWRLVPPPQTMEKYAAWSELRDRMLQPMQIGPTEFLADRLQRIGKPELAIGEWMRIASQHPARYHRAEAALRNAQSLMSSSGREEEAQRLDLWIERLNSQ